MLFPKGAPHELGVRRAATIIVAQFERVEMCKLIACGFAAMYLNHFGGASMGEIARAAGVSKGTLYVYFADKCRLGYRRGGGARKAPASVPF